MTIDLERPPAGVVTRLDSPVGPLELVAERGRLASITVLALHPDRPDWRVQPGTGEQASMDDALLRHAETELAAYFEGTLQAFTIPLAPAATPFAHRLRRAMTAIPYGATARYGDLARSLDSGPRAVGRGCGANPLPIIVPCHRVVGATGLGGYSGGKGLATKRVLLALESRFAGA